MKIRTQFLPASNLLLGHCFVASSEIAKISTTIKYHKFDGLQQQKFIHLQCWRPEIQNPGAALLWKAVRENSFFPLPASDGSTHTWASGCSTLAFGFCFSLSLLSLILFCVPPTRITCHLI